MRFRLTRSVGATAEDEKPEVAGMIGVKYVHLCRYLPDHAEDPSQIVLIHGDVGCTDWLSANDVGERRNSGKPRPRPVEKPFGPAGRCPVREMNRRYTARRY